MITWTAGMDGCAANDNGLLWRGTGGLLVNGAPVSTNVAVYTPASTRKDIPTITYNSSRVNSVYKTNNLVRPFSLQIKFFIRY